MRRCDELAACTEEPGAITRPFATDAMRRAQELAGTWMRDAGMAVTRDNVGDPSRVGDDRWSGERPLAYVEVHIEQGPVLEARGLPVGVVSAIAGQSRYDITFTGEAGHAGTVPMAERRDALVGAATFVGAVA